MLWRGFAIGVIISAPMGPVGILCIQRTLDKGRAAGLYTGIGAAISDLFYCLLTGFGLSFIEDFLESNQSVIQIVGSVVLVIFGIYLFRSNPARTLKKPEDNHVSKKRNILNGFLFTFSNPLIIFLIIGLFARFNFMLPEIKFYDYIIGFGCIILGALGWWWMVTFFVDKVRAHFNLRSMWLINKITGTIIILFGVVGIITSIVALAGAGTRDPIYLNSRNGFNNIISVGTPLTLDAKNGPARQSIPLDESDFTLEFRARNINNFAAKKYRYQDSTGNRMSVIHPAWTITFPGVGTDTITIRIRTLDDPLDYLIEPYIRVTACCGNSLLSEVDISEGMDKFTDWNAYQFSLDNGEFKMRAGNREYRDLLDFQLSGFRPSELIFTAEPGGFLEIDWIRIENFGPEMPEPAYMVNPDSLRSYYVRSKDPIEGYWEVFDRMLEEDYARPGGKYRLAILKVDNGYDMIYISGAEKNPELWMAGMLKGRLEAETFKNIFNLIWYDVDGKRIEGEAVAEFTAPGSLSLQYPYLSSSMRLRKVPADKYP